MSIFPPKNNNKIIIKKCNYFSITLPNEKTISGYYSSPMKINNDA